MSECCDTYGACTRGPNCPARADKANTVPPEAGNVQFDADGVPLSYDETMALVRLMIYLLLGVIVFFGGLGLLVSYGTERWPDVLWAFLSGLS